MASSPSDSCPGTNNLCQACRSTKGMDKYCGGDVVGVFGREQACFHFMYLYFEDNPDNDPCDAAYITWYNEAAKNRVIEHWIETGGDPDDFI